MWNRAQVHTHRYLPGKLILRFSSFSVWQISIYIQGSSLPAPQPEALAGCYHLSQMNPWFTTRLLLLLPHYLRGEGPRLGTGIVEFIKIIFTKIVHGKNITIYKREDRKFCSNYSSISITLSIARLFSKILRGKTVQHITGKELRGFG